MAKDKTRKNSRERSLHFHKERAALKVPILPAVFMDMRGRDEAKKELLGSLRVLFKDTRFKGFRIADIIVH